MMMLDHVLLGGMGGILIENPLLSFTFAFITHFLFDKIPHFFPPKTKLKNQIITATLDLFLSLLVLYLFWSSALPRSVFWGGVGGIIIDIVLVGTPQTLKSKIGQWHIDRQPHREDYRYIALDLAIILIAILIFYFKA